MMMRSSSQSLPSLLQVSTYLLGVCLFSISFLVFLNASVSFVITDIIGQKSKVGDAVGSLGFADELVAIFACPIWGMLSDRLGVRTVSVTGYLLVGLSLFIFVQAQNVYPQLLLARMFFALGGAACTTMVTAILPSISSIQTEQSISARCHSPTDSLDVTHSQAENAASDRLLPASWYHLSGSKLAGFVGTFTGCGALIALTAFLPLPSLFQKQGKSPVDALKTTYYIVGAIAFLVSLVCFFGLHRLKGQDNKGWHNLWIKLSSTSNSSQRSTTLLPYWKLFYHSVRAARNPEIGLGYVGGFVARASSVGISLFIPLLINQDFITRGICKVDDPTLIKTECREAYVLAAKLTGVSQLVALLLAPAFGYFSDRTTRIHIPLLIAAVAGIVGYSTIAFAVQSPDPTDPSGNSLVYLWVSLIGVSQIGAIVCSLGSISKGISESMPQQGKSAPTTNSEDGDSQTEDEPLLSSTISTESQVTLSHLQGSIAGTYSLAGGLAILFLTKVGGALFDSTSVSAPFVIMLVFNVILLVAVIANGAVREISSG